MRQAKVMLSDSEIAHAARAGSVAAGLRQALNNARIIDPAETKRIRFQLATISNMLRDAAAGSTLVTADRIEILNYSAAAGMCRAHSILRPDFGKIG